MNFLMVLRVLTIPAALTAWATLYSLAVRVPDWTATAAVGFWFVFALSFIISVIRKRSVQNMRVQPRRNKRPR